MNSQEIDDLQKSIKLVETNEKNKEFVENLSESFVAFSKAIISVNLQVVENTYKIEKLEKNDVLRQSEYANLVKDLHKDFGIAQKISDKLTSRIESLENQMKSSTKNEASIEENRNKNLIITGIKSHQNENLKIIFNSICAFIGLNYPPLVSIFRFKGKNYPILIKFYDNDEKNRFFRNYIRIAKQMSHEKVFNFKGNHNRIWIQHDMDASTYKLYINALKMKRNKSIDQIHLENGKILIKKTKNCEFKWIKSLEDLNTFINNFME